MGLASAPADPCCLPCSGGHPRAAGPRGGIHPPARADSPVRGDHVPRFRRCGLDLSLARANGARLPRVGSPREPRAARRRLRRGRALLRRAIRRRGRRRQRGTHRGRVARTSLLLRNRSAARNGTYRLRPGRDRALPAGRERSGEGDQGAARGRSRPSAPDDLARGDRGVLQERRARVPDRRDEPRHEARADPRRDPPAAARAPSRRPIGTCCVWPRASRRRSTSCSPRRPARNGSTSAAA